MSDFNHLDEQGRAVMVDVGAKEVTRRTAEAGGKISMSRKTFDLLCAGAVPKGDVFAAARIAGIQAVKRTWELIPLCHPLAVEQCGLTFITHPDACQVEAICRVGVSAKTGVEMEALCGAATALLTIYDMCKALDRSMEIHGLSVYYKAGGKSGLYRRESEGEP